MKRQVILSLRTAFLVTTLVSLIPAFLIILLTGLEHTRAQAASVRAEALRQVEAVAQIQNQTVSSVRNTLETLANLPGFLDSDYGHQEDVLASVLEKNAQLLNVTATDSNGVVTVSPGLATGTDLSQRVHVRDALQTGGFVAGEFIFALVNNQPAIPYSFALHDRSGNLIGTLSVVYPLPIYAEFFDRLELPEETIMGMTDRNGTRLFFRPQKDTNTIGSPIKAEVWEAMSSGEDVGTLLLAGSDGMRRYYAYRRMYIDPGGDPYLYIVVGFPEKVAIEPARNALLRNLLYMVVVIVAAVIVALMLGSAVFGRGFEQLAATAFAISNGNLEARTTIPKGKTEISRLAGAIDDMACALETQARERAKERERIARSLIEKETLLKEIHHRVKNNMQLILSIVHLQRSFTTDLNDFCDDLETRISAMAGVHEMLYESPDLSTINMRDFLPQLIRSASQSSARTDFKADVCDISLRLEYAIPLALIAAELINNATNYGRSADGTAHGQVKLDREDSRLILTVSDEGEGFPNAYDPRESLSLGMRLVQSLAEQLNGSVSVSSGPGATVSVVSNSHFRSL